MDQSCHTLTPLPSPPFRARCALSSIFFINGVVLASWAPHIPAVKARHAISDGQLGIVLLSMAVGAVLALPLAGGLISRFGNRRMTAIAALGFCLALPLPIISPHVGLLALSLMLLGACNGTLDVSMNAQAVEVERHYQRAILSSFHGLFSLGGLVGAGVAGLKMSFGVSEIQQVTTITILSMFAVLSVLHWLSPSPPQQGNHFIERTYGRIGGNPELVQHCPTSVHPIHGEAKCFGPNNVKPVGGQKPNLFTRHS